ncbi:AraC family transcriptional regulator [Pseudomonas costantinii]|uniref:AraC family transcriptional regulator n=1 Tax=Pseudomonas costantinii TaxID=168469 RepID=A0A1S2VB86_9PSED|nr:AraC family transcriptional regulator [Pseudomonas costantinii]OIN54525.1 AraC family transcriptional regulator [Pseudomonas costantinii]OIN54846.1 AraC family transcriptional regulator [Pseudomonas costantinii]OIN55228.1 AraC family transcriptional regulator [Pseudomonas costantinii]SEE06334.1 AraC-type DNA-binding protein [Pseudomonas costantinii]
MMNPLENLIIHPEMKLEGLAKGDLLSQVLAQIRLTGDRVYSTALSNAQCLELDRQSAHICVVQQGRLHLEDVDQPAVTLEQGDIILLPHNPSGVRITACDGPAAVVICRFWFDASSFQAMLFALPRLIHIRKTQAADWAEGILHFMLLEANDTQPGGALMISRLIDLTVIRILRTWVHQNAASGWLGGLSDARIARALKAIHETPGRQWRIDSLAEIAGMSRSNFCDRFSSLVGRSPLRYQNEWRLTLAKTMLAKHDSRIGEIGFAIGYESEAAFSRAYKAFFGRSPRDDNAPSSKGRGVL